MITSKLTAQGSDRRKTDNRKIYGGKTGDCPTLTTAKNG
jgi:hypothetical protein